MTGSIRSQMCKFGQYRTLTDCLFNAAPTKKRTLKLGVNNVIIQARSEWHVLNLPGMQISSKPGIASSISRQVQ
jgi:hypothetical protein